MGLNFMYVSNIPPEPPGKWYMPCECTETSLRVNCDICKNEHHVLVDAIDPIKPCKIEDHNWEMSIEEGRVSIFCVDPHSNIERRAMNEWGNRLGGLGACEPMVFQSEDYYVDGFPIDLEYVDDSTPSTPMSPAEYGYYILVHPKIPDKVEEVLKVMESYSLGEVASHSKLQRYAQEIREAFKHE